MRKVTLLTAIVALSAACWDGRGIPAGGKGDTGRRGDFDPIGTGGTGGAGGSGGATGGSGGSGGSGGVGDCGDAAITGDEVCDGVELGGVTCESFGGLTGDLGCESDCLAFDLSSCLGCGNGILEAGEECEGGDLAGQTCASIANPGGSLACHTNCTFDTGACCNGACAHAACLGTGLCGCVDGDLFIDTPLTGNTVLGDNDSSFNDCGGRSAPDRAYVFTPNATAPFTFEVTSADFDAALYLFHDSCLGDPISCTAEANLPAGPILSADLVSGRATIVVVDGVDVDDEGSFELVARRCDAPQCQCLANDLGTLVGTTTGSLATYQDLTEATCALTGRDTPYRWTAPDTRPYTFSTAGSASDTVLHIRDDCFGDELACAADDDSASGTSALSYIFLAGQEVVIYVSEGAAGGEDFVLEISECPDGLALAAGTVLGNNVGQGNDHHPIGPCGALPDGGLDVSYFWTPAESGTYYINTHGSAFDTTLAVLGAGCGGPLLACNDDDRGLQSGVVVEAVDHYPYVIVIDAYDFEDQGDFELNIERLPDDWTCGGQDYGHDGRCDCGCGAVDPDCGSTQCSDPYCLAADCHDCHGPDGTPWACGKPAPPAGWTCGDAYQDYFCDCGCGGADVDCAGNGCDPAFCDDLTCSTCHDELGNEWRCGPGAPPTGWSCGQRYGDGLCDCGCGALDIDCGGGTGGCVTPYCGQMDCDVCHDTIGDAWPCGQPEPLPGWTCYPTRFGDGTCDCGCVAADVDCAGGCTAPFCDAADCGVCHDPDGDLWSCGQPAPPEEWFCSVGRYGNGSCDCGCGASDIDCGGPDCIDPYCNNVGCGVCHRPDGQIWPCGDPAPPPGWTCPLTYYDDGTCDCGCGVEDSDCGGAGCTAPFCNTLACQRCRESSGSIWTCGQSQPLVGWSCPAEDFADGSCDCGCMRDDPDCGGGGCATPYCDEASCVSCHDFAGGAWSCGQAEPPVEWSCWELSYDNGSCDCGCAVADPDCGAGGCTTAYCNEASCNVCHEPNGFVWSCARGSPPTSWRCETFQWNDGSTCHCGCGLEEDPDCLPAECPVGWTCAADWFTDMICDTGCGIPDPACT